MLALNFRKLIRTWQTRFPFLLDAKFDAKDVFARTFRMPFSRDFNVVKFLAIHPDECLLDIGGNRGQSIRALRIFHPTARIHSFEPNLNLAERLRKKYQSDQDVDIHAFGLGSENFAGALYTPFYRSWMFDGLASFDYESAASWLNPDTIARFDPALLRISETTCTIRRLDDLDLSPVFIKIDVQGLEEQVLRGGIGTLARSRPLLLIEDAHDLVGMLADHGYREFAFDGRRFGKPLQRTTNSFFATSDMLARLQAGGLIVGA